MILGFLNLHNMLFYFLIVSIKIKKSKFNLFQKNHNLSFYQFKSIFLELFNLILNKVTRFNNQKTGEI